MKKGPKETAQSFNKNKKQEEEISIYDIEKVYDDLLSTTRKKSLQAAIDKFVEIFY